MREVMFADDTAFVAHTHQDAQEIITLFAQAAQAFGLKKSLDIKKPKWYINQYQNLMTLGTISYFRVNNWLVLPSLNILKTIRNDNKFEAELEIRMSNASKVFGRLKDKVWNNKDPTI